MGENEMKRLISVVMGAVMIVAASAGLGAQTKTIMGEAETITATVEAIDATTRTLTVKTPKGTLVPITAPAAMQRFSEVKVGDTISARYYDNVVFRVKPAGEAAVDTGTGALTRGTGASPAATAGAQRTITAVIVAIDPAVPSITFHGENVKWNYSSRVNDKAALAKVKVGDRVDVTWTEALSVSVIPPKK